MKGVSEYQKNLEMQCESILRCFSGEDDNGVCAKKFSIICEKLSNDFLPPVDREDIAALSYVLLEISKDAENYCKSGTTTQKDEIYIQLRALKTVVSELINKRKTCGENIRRLMDKNILCFGLSAESKLKGKEYAVNLNRSIAEFLKTAHMSYFKNL